MKPRKEPEVIDLDRRRAAALKKTKLPRKRDGLGPWGSWAVLTAAALVWAAIRMAGA